MVRGSLRLPTNCVSTKGGFYNISERSFWPKTEARGNAAEEVGIVADDGTLLANYSIRDFIAETGKSLAP